MPIRNMFLLAQAETSGNGRESGANANADGELDVSMGTIWETLDNMIFKNLSDQRPGDHEWSDQRGGSECCAKRTTDHSADSDGLLSGWRCRLLVDESADIFHRLIVGSGLLRLLNLLPNSPRRTPSARSFSQQQATVMRLPLR